MKKTIVSLLVLVMLLSGLTACKAETKGNRTIQIPASGIITRSVFESIRDNDDIGIFNGNSNNITYQWLFFGSTIVSPKDENLSVEFTDTRSSMVKNHLKAATAQEFSFSTRSAVEGSPSLSVYLTEVWEVGSVEIYTFDVDSRQATLVGTAALENSPNAIITFIPTEFDGLFYLIGKAETPGNELGDPNAGGGNDGDGGKSQQGTQTGASAEGQTSTANQPTVTLDPSFTGGPTASGGSVVLDRYLTEPTPAGRPAPVEPDEVDVNTAVRYTCTLSIRCDTILNNMNICAPNKVSMVPASGAIMVTRTCVFYEGENVYDVLQRECRSSGIHMSARWTPIYNSVYVEGINNLYEFDVGRLSGWMYKVNGWFPNYGASRYLLQNGDVIEWVYTCDLGRDVGGHYAVGVGYEE
jgi:hypothetical protein